MKAFVYGLIVLLAVLHQDFWWWDDTEPLVLGFLPIGLAYHAAISVLAAVFWAMAVRYCWPADADVVEAEAFRSAEVDAATRKRNRSNHDSAGEHA